MGREAEGFEAWLGELERRSYTSVDDAATDMVELLIKTNLEIELTLRQAGAAESPWDKLREYIRRAVEFIKKIAMDFGAISYSIGVSLTGLDASVEWSGPPKP
jgi:hypothetical protein